MIFAFPHTITYWASTGDGYGGLTFATPAVIKGRWEDRPSRVVGKDEREVVVCSSRFYTTYAVEVNGYAALGTYSGTTPPASARRIQERTTSPSIDGKTELRKAVL